jgi:PleD family two-component response regulator
MPRPTSLPDAPSRPPIVVVGVEQEWAARSLESVMGPHGFALVRAYSGRQTLDLAEVAGADAVLIDSRLPDMDGVDVVRLLRDERRIGVHVPVVLTTSGPAPRDVLRAAYSAGAWSVWEQPVDAELQLLRLQTWVASKRIVDESERVSLVDAESGLYTFRGLSRRAGEMLADARRRKTPVSCIAVSPLLARPGLQMDDGEAVAMLSGEVGRLLGRVARGSDAVGRLGSMEFAVLAPMTAEAGAGELVERMRDALATLPQPAFAGGPAQIAVRAGVTTVPADSLDARDGTDLLLQASTALRYAQSTGSMHVHTFAEVPSTFV